MIDLAASGFTQVWADQIFMEGEKSERIGAEYLASVAIARSLATKYPEQVRVEVPFEERLSGVLLKRNDLHPFPSQHHKGRVDVVLFQDTGRLLPHALIELKRRWQLGPITDDAKRISDFLMSKDSVAHPSIFGFCLFPVLARPSVKTGSTADAFAARLRTVQAALPALQSCYPKLDFEVHRSSGGTGRRPSLLEHEVDGHLVEVVWDPNGFEARIFALAVTYR